MLYYCTLFDNNYLSRGLAMYESLLRHCDDFHLYILAFNDITYNVLKDLSLANTTTIKLSDFEDETLISIKKNRTIAEYCWTCTPSLLLFCIKYFNLPHCTYIDADLYFYSNPKVLFDELNGNSVSLSPHWYTSVYDKSPLTGIYCVQYLTFKNDRFGLEALNWWKNACNNWCYARFEDGKFGDQKYLDDWPSRFSNIHIQKNKGGGFAPWNIQQYKPIDLQNYYFQNKYDKSCYTLIFFHFHDIRFRDDNKIDFGTYLLPQWAIQKLYFPYIQHLHNIEKKLKLKYMCYFHENKIIKNRMFDNFLTIIQRYYIFKYLFFYLANFYIKNISDKNKLVIALQPLLKKLIFNRNIFYINRILED